MPDGWWHSVGLAPDGRMASFGVMRSAAHPDATRVEVPEPEVASLRGDDVLCVVGFDADQADTDRAVSLTVTPRTAPKAPPLWFLELDEPDGQPPATTLVAFSGHGVESGTLLPRGSLSTVGVPSSEQVGAVRWYLGTGELDQVYVAPTSRRQGIATALVVAAGTLQVARGGRRLWSDGQRTSLGEKFRNGVEYGERAADLTHLAPPMTPHDS